MAAVPMKKGAMGRRTGVLNLRRPNMLIFAGNCMRSVTICSKFCFAGKARWACVTSQYSDHVLRREIFWCRCNFTSAGYPNQIFCQFARLGLPSYIRGKWLKRPHNGHPRLPTLHKKMSRGRCLHSCEILTNTYGEKKKRYFQTEISGLPKMHRTEVTLETCVNAVLCIV